MEPPRSPKINEPKSQTGAIKKVPSMKAESETQTAVAVRVPSLKVKPPTGGNSPVQGANMEKLITQEQIKNASLAKKRRMITKKAQGVRTREKTPEPSRNAMHPIPHEDTTTTDEEDARTPKTPEMEATDIYLEMKKMIQEKKSERDADDIDIDAIREAQVEEARERRRRSISPFALPSKEEIERLQRKGSFIDPSNKLLTTVPSYPLTAKDEIDPEIIRKNSLISEDDIRALNLPPSPKLPVKDLSISKGLHTVPTKPKPSNITPTTKRETNQSHTQPKPMPVRVDMKPKQTDQTSNTNVRVTKQSDIQPPTPDAPANSEPPIRPKRSKSGTRSQGRTSESEMSEDQSKPKADPPVHQPRVPKPRERRRTIAAIKRSVRERSPAVRSRSAVRAPAEPPLDVTGIEMTPTTTDIIDLLEKARRRSISMPEDESKISTASRDTADKCRQLVTPKKSSPKIKRKVTTPKTIKIMTKEETLESFLQAQRKSVEIERSRRSSGYIDASQSELTSSCYSSSYSEDESDFDLRKRSDELTKKLNLLKEEKETKKKPPPSTKKKIEQVEVIKEPEITGREGRIKRFFLKTKRLIVNWKNFKAEKREEWEKVRLLGNRCSSDLVILIMLCGFGGLIFRYTEGAFENFYKCGVKRVKRDFIDTLWQGSHNLREEDWKSMARNKLWDFETQLHTAHEAGVKSYSGQKAWSFVNSAIYCLTVVTTIGYGHIAPSTTTGRALTILYAIIGIPLFLILLADFGKLLTRSIKFVWAFVRRLYYTGSCRKVRRTVPVQEVMKGLNMVYEAASTLRRPSQFNVGEGDVMDPNNPPALPPKPGQTPNLLTPPKPGEEIGTEIVDDPQTPAPSVFEIDDEFNLPISVAITCLVVYIFMGACIYMVWEEWTFFESFYFVFISMSTIGFGDFVPNHPIYMMCSIIYLIFGMSLTSMCINVVQVKLSDSFRQASAKIGATIGLKVSEEDGSLAPVTPPPVELPAVHTPTKHSSEYPKPEDVQ